VRFSSLREATRVLFDHGKVALTIPCKKKILEKDASLVIRFGVLRFKLINKLKT